MVDFISLDTNAMRRISLLNAHIGREKDSRNQLYTNVQLLDAGGIFSPGQMDDRFLALWTQYSDEMLTRAWAGNSA
jgi:hypothetical protein